MKKLHFILVFSSICIYSCLLKAQTTEGSYSGDGGPATAAHLNQPKGIAVDASGNLYISDSENNLIRKVDATGTITTIAGTYSQDPHERRGTFTGNDGPANKAGLNTPTSLAFDAQGNLYFCDSRNDQVRKIDASGKITAFAGIGYSVRYQRGTGLGTSALTNAVKPSNIAFDGSGNLLISGDNKIVKVDNSGNLVAVAGGGGNGGYNSENNDAANVVMNGVEGITTDKAGNLYYADASNMIVREIDATTKKVSTVAGWYGSNSNTNPIADKAIKAGLAFPSDVLIDADGNLIIADYQRNMIRKVDAQGNITTIAGGAKGDVANRGDGGQATAAKLDGPYSITFDHSGNLYIAESKSNTIRKVDKSGVITTVAGTTAAVAATGLPPSGIKITVIAGSKYFKSGNTGDGGPAASALLHNPAGLAIDGNGNIYVADQKNNVIRKIDNTGNITTVVSSTTIPAGYSGDGGPATAAAISQPAGMAMDKSGNLYFCDRKNQAIRKVDQAGNISTIIGTGKQGMYNPLYFPKTPVHANNVGLMYPSAIAIDSHNNIYIACEDAVFKITPDGLFHPFAGTGSYGYSGDNGPAKSAQIHDPTALAVNAAGEVFIAESENHVIRKVDAKGIITTICGKQNLGGDQGDDGPAIYATVDKPTCMIFDTKGNLYFADYKVEKVRKIDADGKITCVLTNKLPDFQWNDNVTQFPGMDAIAFDKDGNLYFADFCNNIIREISGL